MPLPRRLIASIIGVLALLLAAPTAAQPVKLVTESYHLRPQQAARNDDGFHPRPDRALRPRRQLSLGDSIRPPARRALLDGLHCPARI